MKSTVHHLSIFIMLVLSLNCHAQLSVSGYTNYSLSGFDVLVEDEGFNIDSIQTNVAVNLLESHLTEISQFNIDQVILDSLKAVPIFLDWNTTTGAAQYHPSEAWLIANGYPPEKVRSLEISNVTNFINWTDQNQPYMVLHELAHAYHHRVLNNNSMAITNAFSNANSSNLYTNISYHNGGGNYSIVPTAYALNSEAEFFAELTEAYFGQNDYYPFNHSDLKNYDPVGLDAMISIWGDITLTTNVFSRIGINEINTSLYSSGGIFIINLGDKNFDTKRSELVDINGNAVFAVVRNIEDRIISIDMTNEPSGIYFFKINQNGDSKALHLVKR